LHRFVEKPKRGELFLRNYFLIGWVLGVRGFRGRWEGLKGNEE